MGILDLLGDGGHVEQSPERDEDEPGRREHRVQSPGKGRPEIFHTYGAQTDEEVKCHQGQESGDESDLKPGGSFYSDDIENGESQTDRQGDQEDRESGEKIDHLGDTEDGERGLQGKSEPAQNSGDGSHQRPESAGDEIIVSPGLGHGRGQLGHAENPDQGEKPGQGVGENHRRTGPGKGQSRENKNSRTDHRSRRQAEEMSKAQSPLQLPRWLFTDIHFAIIGEKRIRRKRKVPENLR